MSNIYDYIIIGGGLSGLTLCMNLPKHKKILCLEKLSRYGGRIKSIEVKTNNKKHYIEKGAARFHKNQTNLMNLINKLNLKDEIIEYPSKLTCDENMKYDCNTYNIIKKIINLINNDKTSNNHTFLEYMKKKINKTINEEEYKQVKNSFEYFETLDKMNAKEAAKILINYDPNIQFYTMKNGLSSLIDNMVKYIKKHNTNVTLKTTVNIVDIKIEDNIRCISDESNEYNCKEIILAIPGKYLNNFKISKDFKEELKSVHYKNLNRLYGIYDTKEDWMNYERLITQENNKYMLSHDKIQLLSYTDGKKADYWFDLYLKDEAKNKIHENIEKIFNCKIKKANKIYNFYWEKSLGIWKPKVNSNEIQKKMLNPIQNVYTCGDTFSNYQNWMEGALENVFMLINYMKSNKYMKSNVKGGNKNKQISFVKSKKQRQTRKNKKNNEYTFAEVKKHNQRNDAWMVINNKIYDLTPWIDSHPGGDVILKYVGKDGTKVFESIHPSYVMNKILPKYYIGKLKKNNTKKK